MKSWPGPGAGGACPPPALTGQDVHVTVLVLVEGFSSLLDGKLAEHPGNALEDTEPLRHGTVKKTGFPLLAGQGTFIPMNKSHRVVELYIEELCQRKKRFKKMKARLL